MNVAQIQANLYQRLGFITAPDAIIIARLLGYIDATHRQLLAKKNMAQYRFGVMPFTCTANNPFVALPQAVTRVKTIQDRTNQRTLDPITLDDIRREDPGLILTSTFPYAWAKVNLASAVALQPSAAAELFVKSDAAGDGATKTAFLEGIITGGYYRSVSVALNGVTAVSFGATITNWIEVQKFYIALTAGGVTTAAGNVTLTQTSGVGTELARIPIGRAYPRYSVVQLYPYPSVSNTYYADVELHVETMTQATDEPLIPEDYHELLTIGGLMREYQRRQWPVQYAEARAEWKDLWGDLCVYAARDGGPAATRGMSRFSQLGPYFPNGS